MPRFQTTSYRIRFCIVTLTVAMAPFLFGAKKEAGPPVSQAPLTAEQLAVYKAVLLEWFKGEKIAINLAEITSAPGDDDADCLKGHILEAPGKEVHRFQSGDIEQLDLKGEIRLVDPDAQAKEVRNNDPGTAIRNGKSVDEAVRTGFEHGLFTLGEVQFDRDHTHAVVSFSFHCGALCGHGSTMQLEKKNGIWKPGTQCGGWVS